MQTLPATWLIYVDIFSPEKLMPQGKKPVPQATMDWMFLGLLAQVLEPIAVVWVTAAFLCGQLLLWCFDTASFSDWWFGT